MNTPLIIKASDFSGMVEIPSNLRAEKLNPCILLAQDFDLSRLMGDRFYSYFISFFNTNGTIKEDAPDAIKSLYSGTEYTVEGITFSYAGIKPVIVFFAAAKLIGTIDLHITPNSFATKINEYSDQPSQGRRIFMQTSYENTALAYWEKAKGYLSNDRDLYPEYFLRHCGCWVEDNNVRIKRVSVGGY